MFLVSGEGVKLIAGEYSSPLIMCILLFETEPRGWNAFIGSSSFHSEQSAMSLDDEDCIMENDEMSREILYLQQFPGRKQHT